jgi:hypothetical protein
MGVQITEELRKNEPNGSCPCNISYSMQMKEKICLTGLLLGTNHGCITTKPNQIVLQCNRNGGAEVSETTVKILLCCRF